MGTNNEITDQLEHAICLYDIVLIIKQKDRLMAILHIIFLL